MIFGRDPLVLCYKPLFYIKGIPHNTIILPVRHILTVRNILQIRHYRVRIYRFLLGIIIGVSLHIFIEFHNMSLTLVNLCDFWTWRPSLIT